MSQANWKSVGGNPQGTFQPGAPFGSTTGKPSTIGWNDRKPIRGSDAPRVSAFGALPRPPTPQTAPNGANVIPRDAHPTPHGSREHRVETSDEWQEMSEVEVTHQTSQTGITIFGMAGNPAAAAAGQVAVVQQQVTETTTVQRQSQRTTHQHTASRAETQQQQQPEPEPEDTEDADETEPQSEADRLMRALRRRNINTMIAELTELRNNHQYNGLEPNVSLSVTDLLLAVPGERWPHPIAGRCPHFDCEATGIGRENHLRRHMKNDHNWNVAHNKDELLWIFEAILERDLLVADASTDPPMMIPQMTPQHICHLPGCNTTQADASKYRTHLNKHAEYNRNIGRIGLFWATMREWAMTYRNTALPTVYELLCPKKRFRCLQCNYVCLNLEGMMSHATRAHNGRLDYREIKKVLHQLDAEHPIEWTPLEEWHQALLSERERREQEARTAREQERARNLERELELGNRRAMIEEQHEQDEDEMMLIEEDPLTGPDREAQTYINQMVEDQRLTWTNDHHLNRILTEAYRSRDVCRIKNTLRLMREKYHIEGPRVTDSKELMLQLLKLLPAEKWPTIAGGHECPACLAGQGTTKIFALTSHWRHHTHEDHQMNPYVNEIEALVGVMLGSEPKRFLVNPARERKEAEYYRCPVPGCTAVRNTEIDITSHFQTCKEDRHKVFRALTQSVGLFYARFITMYAKHPMLTVSQFVNGVEDDTVLYRCKRCGHVDTTPRGMERHMSAQHGIHEITHTTTSHIAITLFNNDQEDDMNAQIQARISAAWATQPQDLRTAMADQIYAQTMQEQSEASSESSSESAPEQQARPQVDLDEIRRQQDRAFHEEFGSSSSSDSSPEPGPRNEPAEPVQSRLLGPSLPGRGLPFPPPTFGVRLRRDHAPVDQAPMPRREDGPSDTDRTDGPEQSGEEQSGEEQSGEEEAQHIPPPSDSDHSSPSGSESESPVEIETDDYDEFANQALQWLRESRRYSKVTLRVPKLTKARRKKIKEGLVDLFKNQLIPLIETAEKAQNGKPAHVQWQILEGTYEQCMRRIRSHIMAKLELEERNMTRRPRPRFVNEQTAEQMEQARTIKNLNSLRKRLAKYMELINSYDQEHATNRNQRLRLEEKIIDIVRTLPEEVRERFFNGASVPEMMAELQANGQREEYLDWFANEILANSPEAPKNTGLADEYADDPGKTIKNYVLSLPQPMCKVSLAALHELHAKNFAAPIVPYTYSAEWKVRNKLEGKIDEQDLDQIFTEDKIAQMVKSRKANSAAGPDGVGYGIFKEAGRPAIKFLKILFTNIWKHEKVPGSWNKTVIRMLYKKGDPNVPNNWRPISLTSAVYRMYTCLLSRTLGQWHQHHSLFNHTQQGFVPTGSTFTNSTIIQELFNEAQRKNDSLIVVTLDFRNAFGSTHHDLIFDTMHQKGIPEKFIRVVQSLYKRATVRIETDEGADDEIRVEVGTRQGCPLSPALFNLCIEPLLEKLRRKKELGYKLGDDYVNVLAYADDIILIAPKTENMTQLIGIAEQFCKYTKMELVPAKCCTYSYTYDDNRHRSALSQPLTLNGTEIPLTSLDASVRYLGIGIAARKTDRLQSTYDAVRKLRENMRQVMESKLPISQKLHAYNTILVPELEFQLSNGQCDAHALRDMDQNARGAINGILGGTIPIAVHHSPLKDGGLGIKQLEMLRTLAPIKASLKLLLNPDPVITRLAQHFLEEEGKKRKVVTKDDGSGQFFGWTGGGKGTNSVFGRAYKMCQKLNLKIEQKQELICITDLTEEEEVESPNPTKLCQELTKMLMKRTTKQAHQPTFHLHQMKTFEDCKAANNFVQDYKAPKADAFVKFAICARVNALMTPELIDIKHHRPRAACQQCTLGTNASLCHIINGCPTNNAAIQERHNMVMRIIIEELTRKNEYINVQENSTLRVAGLSEANRTLKPDAALWSSPEELLLIEANVPYGKQTVADTNLEDHYDAKLDKYRDLMDELQTLRLRANMIVIVISSTGAIAKKTTRDLKRYFLDKSDLMRVQMRMSRSAIKGSALIWWERGRAIREQRGEELPNEAPVFTEEDLLSEEAVVEQRHDPYEVASEHVPSDEDTEEQEVPTPILSRPSDADEDTEEQEVATPILSRPSDADEDTEEQGVPAPILSRPSDSDEDTEQQEVPAPILSRPSDSDEDADVEDNDQSDSEQLDPRYAGLFQDN